MAKKLTFVILTAVVLVALVGCLPKINQPPVVTEVTAPATVPEKSSFEVSAKASDPEGAAVTVQFAFGSVTKDGVLDGGVYKATFTAPDVSSDQDITLTVIAYDDKGKASTPKTKTITVIANKAPSIVSLEAPSSVDEEKPFTATATVSDPNGLEDLDRVVFTFGGNEFVVTSHTDGVFVGSITAPAVDENQTFVLSAKAYDKDGNESAPVTRNVQVINLTKSVVTAVKALGTTFREGQEITVRATVTSSHPMNTTVTITVDGVPKTATRKVTGATSVYEATFTLALVDEDTDIEISAQAFDAVNGQYSELAYDYITIDANDTPVGTVTVDEATMVFEEGTNFTVKVELADADGDTAFGTVTYNGEDYGPLYDGDTVELTAALGATEIVFNFTDGYEPDPKSGSDSAEITVLEDAVKGTIEAATVSEVATAGGTIDVTWKATDDDPVLVKVTFDSPDVMLEEATSSALEGSVSVTVPGTLTVDTTVTVTIELYLAEGALQDSTSADVAVVGNDVPEIYVTPTTFEATENTVITFTVKATDTIGSLATLTLISDTVEFAATQMAFDGDKTITGTLTSFEGAASTPLSVTVKVEDIYGIYSEETLTGTILDYNAVPSATLSTTIIHVAEGGEVSITVDATDSDGLASIEWELLDESGTVVDSGTLEATTSQAATFTAPAVSAITNYTFKVTVTDAKTGHPVSTTAEATVVVHNKPDIEVSLNPATAVAEDDRVTVVVTITDDTTVTDVYVSLVDSEGGVGTIDSSETTGLNSSDTVIATFVIKAPVSARPDDLAATITVVATGAAETGVGPLSSTYKQPYTILNASVPVIEINSIDVYENYTLRVSNTNLLPHRTGYNYKARFNLNIQAIAPGADQLKLVLLGAEDETTVFATDLLDLVESGGNYYAELTIPASYGAYVLKIEKADDPNVFDKLTTPVIIYNADEAATVVDYEFTPASTNNEGTTTIAGTGTLFTATITGVFKDPMFTIGSVDLSDGTITVVVTDSTHPESKVGDYYVATVTFVKLIDTTTIDSEEGLYTALLKLPFERPVLSGSGLETTYVSTSETVLVDNKAPELSLTNLTNYGTNATLTFKFSDLGAKKLAYSVYNSNGAVGTSTEYSGPTPTMVVVVPIDLSSWPVSDAWNATVSLIATDAAGHVATLVSTSDTLDTALGTIVSAVDSDGDNYIYIAATNISSAKLAEDRTGVSTAVVTVDSSTVGAGTFTVSITSGVAYLSAEVANDGIATITVTATDLRGNASDSTLTLVFDTTLPTVGVESSGISAPPVNTANLTDASLTYTATDANFDTATITFYTDSVVATVIPVNDATEDANLATTLYVPYISGLDFTLVKYEIEAVDLAGNDHSTSLTFYVDDVFAEATIDLAPIALNSDDATNATAGTFEISLTDAGTIASMTVELSVGTLTYTSATNVTTLSTSVAFEVPDSTEATVVATLTATDTTGNSTSVSTSFKVDAFDPRATFTGVQWSGDNAVATLVATDLFLKSYTVTLEGESIGATDVAEWSATTYLDASNGTSVAFTMPDIDFQFATLTAVVLDVLGHETVISTSATIDTKVGTFALASTSPDKVNIAASNAGVFLTIIATDLNPGTFTSLAVAADGAAIHHVATEFVVDTLVATVFFVGGVDSTDCTVTFTATDASGNTANLVWSFTADTKAPTLSEVLIGSNGDKVWITFDEEIVLQTPATVTAKVGGTIVGVVTDVTQLDAYTIRADFSGVVDFQGTNTYTIVVAADSVKDLLGNANLEISTTTAATSILAPSR